MHGKAVFNVRVAPNGEVTGADVASNEGLSTPTTSCLVGVLSRAQFTGNGAATTLRIPLSFVQQR